MDFKGQFNLITNSMVKDKAFLEQIEPSLLVFADENFYMSPTEYCYRFYEDVIDAVRKYDLFIAVSEYEVPLILNHYPELKGHIFWNFQ